MIDKKLVMALMAIVLVAVTCRAVESADSVAASSSRGWNPRPKLGHDGVRFAWGAEFGSTIDMSGSQMSSIDFTASAGVSYKWLSLGGIGVGADIMVSNSDRVYPIFAVCRTDFSQWVKVLFIDARAGVALNYMGSHHQSGAYVSPSIGFNLATGATFRSYLTVGYTFISRKGYQRGEEMIHLKSLSMATVRLGVSF